jgi:hypothetical protein
MARRPFTTSLLAYSALTLVLTWPLILHLTSTVPHDLGDPLLSTSILWWNAHVWPLTDRWWNGFAFYPLGGMLAFSDHRLGESAIASPLQWLGCSPVAAYNLTLLATFPLSAIAAHWLAHTLTRRHDAAAICGLAFGFNPYRWAHIEHLELLAAFGMPAALAALHAYRASHARRWLVAFWGALVIQGLCTSYYLAFFGVVLALWILWYLRCDDWRSLGAIVLASLAGIAVLVPIAIGYLRIHSAYGLSRGLGEILAFSGDVTSLVTASGMSALWGWTSSLNGPERQLFPGLTIAVLAALGAILALRRHRPFTRDGGIGLAIALWIAAALFVAVAVSTLFVDRWAIRLGPLRLAADVFFKPMSMALLLTVAGLACHPIARAAWRRRSDFTFYLLAALFLFLCSFGPKPAFRGYQVLYEPPYAWLMRLPVFGGELRSAARFAMPAALMLSAAAALAFNRFGLSPRARRVAVTLAIVGIVADSSVHNLPLPQIPERWSADRAAAFDAVVELPAGAGFLDPAAMYRSTQHGRPVVNGISGFVPPHYAALQMAVEEKDDSALDAVAATGRVLFAVDGASDPDHHWRMALDANARATPVGTERGWSFFTLRPPPATPICTGTDVPIRTASFNGAQVTIAALVDRRAETLWATSGPQGAGDALVFDLGAAARPCAILMSLGKTVYLYPRRLNVETSLDGTSWTSSFDGSTSAVAIRAGLDDPADPWLPFPLPEQPARFIRLRLEASHPTLPWVIADVVIRGRGDR